MNSAATFTATADGDGDARFTSSGSIFSFLEYKS